MAKIVPPIHFGLVEDGKLNSSVKIFWLTEAAPPGFYRSAQPSELNFSFLEKLNLRSLIYVGAEEPSEILCEFLDLTAPSRRFRSLCKSRLIIADFVVSHSWTPKG